MRGRLGRVLVSPNFLFRLEASTVEDESHPVSAEELATRLSYFLWSAPPDDELRQLAINGELIKTDVLVQQTRRMLKDSRSNALASECFGQWLGFHRFESFNAISTEKYPEFTPALRKAMYLEAQRFCEDVVSNNGSVWDILDADHTFLNEDLAKHYGIPWTGGSGFKRVEGVRQYQRGGIAGMAFFLTQSSAPLRPSPIKRGKFIYSTLLRTTERTARAPVATFDSIISVWRCKALIQSGDSATKTRVAASSTQKSRSQVEKQLMEWKASAAILKQRSRYSRASSAENSWDMH